MNRKIDELGRIVIPAEIRKQFGIKANDELNIGVENGKIVLFKAEYCNKLEELTDLLYTWGELLDPKFQEQALNIIQSKNTEQ